MNNDYSTHLKMRLLAGLYVKNCISGSTIKTAGEPHLQ